MYWVYILKCDNGHYYTGYTNNLERRYQEHVTGSAKCKYTRSFKPVSLEKAWCIDEQSQAMRIESAIKRLNKSAKEKLILYPDTIEKLV